MMVMRLTTKLKEYKQEKALPYLRTKFFAYCFLFYSLKLIYLILNQGVSI